MRCFSVLVLVGFCVAVTVCRGAPERRILLVCGAENNGVAQGLRALGIKHERVSPAAYAKRSPFRYDLIIWGMDEPRSVLESAPEQVAAFVDSGGMLLCFRRNAPDPWLPVGMKRDKAYEFGRILRPEHPLFTTPHRMTREAMLEVHGGSIYDAFCDLGPGWVPLVSTGREQGWDKRKAVSTGEHCGIVELKHGAGRILLVQMIPAYNWFRDRKGDSSAAGARFFENIVRYALDRAPARAAARPPAVVPKDFFRNLADVLATLRRGDGLPMDKGWRFSAKGPYTMKTDRRGVLTVTHANVPSTAGNFAQVSRSITIPAHGTRIVLRWYESDTYCGGRERILGGANHGKTAAMNFKKAMRFSEVLVNGQSVWEEDVLGRNPQPARARIHWLDITEAVQEHHGACQITLRVQDRKGSEQDPFAIDVFWAVVDVLTDLTRLPAAAAFKGKGFRPAGNDGVLALEQDNGSLVYHCAVPEGRYRAAIELRDGVQGRSSLQLKSGLRTIGAWTLTADDHRWYWAVSRPIDLSPGKALKLVVRRDGAEQLLLRQVAVIPERLIKSNDATRNARTPRPRAQARVQFPVSVAETAGVSRTAEITAQGLPFPLGCVHKLDQIAVRNSNGNDIPCQARLIAKWPDDSVKVALVCFPVDVGARATARYTVEAGGGVLAKKPETPLVIRETSGKIQINTGRISATLSTTHGRIVDEVLRGKTPLKHTEEMWELVLEDENGRTLRSGGPTVTKTEVVDRGPLRALIVRRGTFADASGNAIEYRLQLEMTAGSDALGLQAIIVNREDTPEVYLRRWSMRIERHGAASGCVWLAENEPRTANAEAVLYQHRENTLTWTGADRATGRAKFRSPGFVRLPGLAIGTRWFWQKFPQAIRFEDQAVRFDFIPQAFDGKDLPTRWRDRMRTVTTRYAVGGVGYPQSPGKMGLFRLARGEALSQQVRFVFDGRDKVASVRKALTPLTARLRAVPAPAYTAATRAFGQFNPADVKQFPHYEDAVERLYKQYMAIRQKRREYGFENFGDDTFEWGYGPSYTYWSNSEYDHHHGFAIQYLRSADPKWWEICEQQARMYRDVVVIHHAPEGSLRRGGPRHHNATAQWMPQHDEQYWVADHTVGKPSAGHSWAQGMVDYWFLTGDPWAEETVHELADWYCDIAENNRYGAGGQERGPGWALIAVSALANALHEERIMQAGRIIADWIINWQDPIRGVISVPISEQPSYEGGSTFMHGIVGRGLGRWYDVTGDPRVKEACIGISEWITTEPMSSPGRWWYKQSPNNSKSYSATSQCLTALSYAYALSDDPWFADIALALLRQTGASVRSISWYPQALNQLARLLSPAEITVAPAELIVAPGQPGDVEVTVRNTVDRNVVVRIESVPTEPFRIAAPPPLTVAPGKTGKLPMRLMTTGFPVRAQLRFRAQLTAAGEETVVRQFRISARAVQRIVRIESGVDAARITAPMALAGPEADRYAYTPRGPDFVAKPRAKGGNDGGWAAWTFDTPVAGNYTIGGEVYWLDAEGNSFYFSLDGGPEVVFGNNGRMQQWLWIELPPIHLKPGKHTVRIRSREDGARIRRVRLSGLMEE